MRRLPLCMILISASVLGACATSGSLIGPSSSSETSITGSIAPANTAGVSGTVLPEAVLNGDTMVVGGKTIRLYGIDAAEPAQQCIVDNQRVPCGTFAKNTLIGLVAGTTVKCGSVGVRDNGGEVSKCFADGYDLSAGMTRTGFAVAYRKQSLNYVPQEQEAKNLKRGMWKSKFVMPWTWRSQHPG